MNTPINYELKITKTMYNGSSYRYCFYVPVKGGFITQFKRMTCVVNGDRFALVLGNDEAAMQKHVNVVSSGTAIAYKTPFMAMYRQGNAMIARVTGGKINAEILDSLLGEYSNSTVVYRGADGYVLAYRCAHRHNFDNTKSNATDVTANTSNEEPAIPVVGGTMTKPDGTIEELGPGFIGHRKDMNPIDEMADKIKESRDETFLKTAAAAANPVIKKLDTAEKLKLYQSEYDHLEDKYDILVERYGELEAKYKKLRDSMQKLVIKSVEAMTAKDDEALCQLVENSVGNLFDIIIKTTKEDE